jgi:hypothetical protein
MKPLGCDEIVQAWARTAFVVRAFFLPAEPARFAAPIL